MAREIDETTSDATELAATAADVQSAVIEAESEATQAEQPTETEQPAGEPKVEEPKAEEPKAEGPSDKELFEAFKAAVQASLEDEGRDETTGTMSASASAPVGTAYAALATRYKGEARSFLQDKMTEAMSDNQYAAARSYLDLLNSLKAAVRKEPAPRIAVDPTDAYVDRVVSLMLSPNLVEQPEGLAEDWQQRAADLAQKLGPEVVAYRNWLATNAAKPEDEREAAPEVNAVVLAAAAVAKGRAVTRRATTASGTGTSTPRAPRQSTGDGTRRNIAAHIQSAFKELPSGSFLSVGDIVKHRSEEYGDESPSQGAIAARLFPGGDGSKCNVEGIRAEIRDKKGAVKL